MISSQDRSGWFGASDTARIMAPWSGKTFSDWWLVKLGVKANAFSSVYMQTGTYKEHQVLDFIRVKDRDRQIKKPKLRLRVNLDGEDAYMVHEVKTYHKDVFSVSKAYWQQAQVEMFATGKQCRIVAYRVTDEDYKNYFLPIDPDRLSYHYIQYDAEWVKREYLPRLRYLADCLRKGVWPDERAVA